LSREFVDDCRTDLIHAHFWEHDLRGHLEAAGKRRVLVTNEGIAVLDQS
jgi:hypothetical protein